MSLDWQEAPSGFLNLTTPRAYTVREVRDLINGRLLPRGFTLLAQDDVLSLVDVKKLDPSMVPRVGAEELDKHDPHEFVKVSFVLDRLMAETAVDELKPMLSPNGKLTALKETNRIEAIDAVVNLREIRALILSEQSPDSRRYPPQVFKLKYRLASEILKQLESLLGVESKGAAAAPMNPQQMQEAQMRAQMMAQQGQPQGQGGKPGEGAKPKAKSEITLVADDRNNCIIAHATPDKLAAVKQAIAIMDVPLDREPSLAATLGRMQVYHLATMNPVPLVKTLKELGDFDMRTKLEADEKNGTIIADATPADHAIIGALIAKLDGTGRDFHVIPLKVLLADDVAGTIAQMFRGGRKEEKKTGPRFVGWVVWTTA